MITPAKAAPIEWVPVANPGNAADTTGYGDVAYTFDIMKYEFTNTRYAEFLNAIDPEGTNPQGVWAAQMNSSNQGGISQVPGNALGSKYVVKTDFADKPVNFLSSFSVARVANWLQNGSPVSPTTTDSSGTAPQNTGVYAIGTATSGTLPAKSAGALYWIPLENEWYKAAYYNPNDSTYYDFANGRNTAPTAVASGTADNTAVYGQSYGQGPADVTNAGSLSPYGVMALAATFMNGKRVLGTWLIVTFLLVGGSAADPGTIYPSP